VKKYLKKIRRAGRRRRENYLVLDLLIRRRNQPAAQPIRHRAILRSGDGGIAPAGGVIEKRRWMARSLARAGFSRRAARFADILHLPRLAKNNAHSAALMVFFAAPRVSLRLPLRAAARACKNASAQRRQRCGAPFAYAKRHASRQYGQPRWYLLRVDDPKRAASGEAKTGDIMGSARHDLTRVGKSVARPLSEKKAWR